MSTGKNKTKKIIKETKSKDLQPVAVVPVDYISEDDISLENEEDEILINVEDVKVEETSIKQPVEKKKKKSNVVRYDPYKAYLAQIRNYPLLDSNEEHDIAIKYQNSKDPLLAQKLVTSNLRLVVKIAHEYHKAHYDLIDLIQEGNIGLLMAVEKFDPLRGVKLSTYSSWWIRAYILKYLLNNSRLVKIGTTQAQRKLFFNLNKQQELLKSKGIVPTSENIAEALDVRETEVKEMQKRMQASDLSISTPLKSDESGSKTILDTMADKSQTPEELVETDEIHRIVVEKISKFKKLLLDELKTNKGKKDIVKKVERNLVIMEDRLLSDNPMTLKEIGDRYGISRERARQLEKRLLQKLRDFLEDELGDNIEIALGFNK